MSVYKIGVISDVHGNLPALEAIYKKFDSESCDEVIHTGDAINMGARSRECLNFLLSRPNTTLLLGNHDRDYLLNKSEHVPMSHVSEAHKNFVFKSLGEELKKEVAKFPVSVMRTIGSQKLMFTHYAVCDPTKTGYLFLKIESFPTADKLDAMFSYSDADAIFFGHKHEPCDIKGKKLYVDVGSVGCHTESEANGIIIDVNDGDWSYRRVCAPYDRELVLREMRDVGIPDANYIFDFYFEHNFGTDGEKSCNKKTRG